RLSASQSILPDREAVSKSVALERQRLSRRSRCEEKQAENAPWPQSKCSSEDLGILEHRFLVRSDGECPWRSAQGGDFPAPKDSEIVLFASFLEHGLSMPVCNFMEGLLYYYKIQLHHLTPNSVLHI